jgi:hypothetical protein
MQAIDFSTPKIVMYIGRPKSGKSNAMKMEIIKNVSKGIWKHGLIFTASAFNLFDDLIGILNTRNNPYLINLLSIHRHIGVSVLIGAQLFKSSATSQVVRCCLNYGIFFRTEKNDIIKAIYDEFGTEFKNYEDFKRHFLTVTKQPFTALYYSQDAFDFNNNFFAIKYPDVSKLNVKLLL